MSDRIWRFLVVGCGRMGRRRAATVCSHPRAELSGVVDNDPDRAQWLADETGAAPFDDLAAALAAVPADVVVVSSPNVHHAQHSMVAMDSGCHVLCEKPLAVTTADAAAMVASASRNGVTLKVGANTRYFRTVDKTIELVQHGCIGQILSLRGWIGNDGLQHGSWFADPRVAGGGTVLDNMTHLLDLVRLLTTSEAVSVVGETATLLWPVDVEDNAFATFRLADGQIAALHSSWTEWRPYLQLDVHGTDGWIGLENRLPVQRTVLYERGGETRYFDFATAPGDPYAAELDHYLRCLDAGDEPLPSGLDGLRVVEMAQALYEAARTGRRQPVDHACVLAP